MRGVIVRPAHFASAEAWGKFLRGLGIEEPAHSINAVELQSAKFSYAVPTTETKVIQFGDNSPVDNQPVVISADGFTGQKSKIV
tara:strand:- start:251 stop:502 length:252 start_codon:yes stop_codon:yes gene_type:complete